MFLYLVVSINFELFDGVSVNEVVERFAFLGLTVNLTNYLISQMHETIPDAATHLTDWTGAAFVLTIFGAFIADAYLGRFRTIIVFSTIYTVVNTIL